MIQKKLVSMLFSLGVGLGLALSSASAGADPQLHFLTHEFSPLNFTRNGEVTGLAAEVMRELQRRTHVEGAFDVMPFARAYITAKTMPNVALFFVTRDAEREKLFQWVGPIANVPISFFATKRATLKIDNMDDAKRATAIFVHHGSHPEQLLRKLGYSNLRPLNSINDVIRMMYLPGNENSLALLTAAVVPNALEQLGLPSDAVRQVYAVDKAQGYIAFSRDTPPAVVAEFQKALDDMKRDGTFATIYAKWFPHEKPPGMKADPAAENQ